MIVDEGFLEADETRIADAALGRVDVDDAQFLDTQMGEADRRRYRELEIGRLEGRVALQEECLYARP